MKYICNMVNTEKCRSEHCLHKHLHDFDQDCNSIHCHYLINGVFESFPVKCISVFKEIEFITKEEFSI